jgi:hypothetical protein
MLKQAILASIFCAAASAAFAQVPAAPPAGAPAPAAPPAAGAAPAPQQPMSFFITSAVPGTGNLGGLAGADKICQTLAAAVGSSKTFHAYLSTQEVAAANGQPAQPAVNARDRIGNGPWYNAKGTLIAMNVNDLHGDVNRDRNAINKLNSLDETGNQIPGFESPQGQNRHDMLTGTDSDGHAFPAGMDMTCSNWTSDATTGRAMLGHTDREGGANTSWNNAHLSAGCDTAGLIRTGGNGRFYCFATN